MVTIGAQNSPEVDLISTVPTIGPVQANETNTNVKAMKKMPPKPAFTLLAVALVDQIAAQRNFECSAKNDAANTMNTIKSMMLKT